jgi:hypothetical protein
MIDQISNVCALTATLSKVDLNDSNYQQNQNTKNIKETKSKALTLFAPHVDFKRTRDSSHSIGVSAGRMNNLKMSNMLWELEGLENIPNRLVCEKCKFKCHYRFLPFHLCPSPI